MSERGISLTIDDIFELLELENDKIIEALENFRDEHCDMCFAHKNIVEICENTDESASKEVMNKALNGIMSIAIQHTSYWVEK